MSREAPTNHFVGFLKFLALAGVAIFAVAFFIGLFGDRTPNPGRTYSPPVDADAIEIEASALGAAFKQNEIRAREQYKGVRLKVRGRITSIGVEILGRPYFVLDDAVQVVFSQADSSRLARFDKNDIITARCEDPSKVMYVIMTGCLF